MHNKKNNNKQTFLVINLSIIYKCINTSVNENLSIKYYLKETKMYY